MRDIRKYTDEYMQSNFEDYQLQYRRKKILEIVYLKKPKKILEIGCGMKPLFQFLDYEYTKYVVVEPSETFYYNALMQAEGNPKIICYNNYFGVDNIVFDTEFDMIICSSLLHEVETPQTIIQAIHSICNKDTIVHINVPNANSFHRLLAKQMRLILDEHEMSERNILYQQHTVFDTQSLCKLLEDGGFKICQSGSYFIKPFTHEQMYEMLKNNIIDETVLDGLFGMTDILPQMGSEIYVNCISK